MGVAHLRFRPPPRGGQPARGGQVGGRGADEGINVVENAETLSGPGPGLGFHEVKSMIRLCKKIPVTWGFERSLKST
ncbi:hypothetical protein HerbRD11066_08940 [Herbidospora sp. RD11066]